MKYSEISLNYLHITSFRMLGTGGFVDDLTVDVIFDAKHTNVHSYAGFMSALAMLLAGGISGPCLFMVVRFTHVYNTIIY